MNKLSIAIHIKCATMNMKCKIKKTNAHIQELKEKLGLTRNILQSRAAIQLWIITNVELAEVLEGL